MSISYQSRDFIITNIGEDSIKNNANIYSILFSDDSHLESINKFAFFFFFTKKTIPSSFNLIDEFAFYINDHIQTVERPSV